MNNVQLAAHYLRRAKGQCLVGNAWGMYWLGRACGLLSPRQLHIRTEYRVKRLFDRSRGPDA